MKKIIVLNFKTYSSDVKSVEDAKGYDNVFIAPPLPLLSESVKIHDNVLSQHADPVTYGRYTGHVPPVMLKDLGVKGVLLNHSEDRIAFNVLKETVDMCKQNKLLTIVCAQSPDEVKEISGLHPDYIAIEPPELIGTGVAVSEAEPDIIIKSIRQSNVPILCGAGISSSEDVKKALELGAYGVLIASAYIKNKKRKEWLEDIVSLF